MLSSIIVCDVGLSVLIINKRSEMGLKDTLNSLLIYINLDDDPVPPTPIVCRVQTSRVLFYFNGQRKLPICW